MSEIALRIENENDAWAVLQEALEGRIPADLAEISFVGWPTFQVKLRGEGFQSSLTPRIMDAFIQLQRDIYRTYAQIYLGRPTAAALTNDEKAALDFFVQVGPGSTDLKAIFDKALEKLTTGMVSKMEAKHWTIVLVSVAVMWGGNSCLNTYLQDQKDQRQVQAQQFAQELDYKRNELLVQAMDMRPELRETREDMREFYNALLKVSTRADSVEMGGHTIPKGLAKDLVRKPRERSQEVQLNGVCRILKVDSSKAQNFYVDIRLEDGRTCTAELQEGFIADKERNLAIIRDAEWQKKPVYLTINGHELRGEITKAVIIDAKDAEL